MWHLHSPQEYMAIIWIYLKSAVCHEHNQPKPETMSTTTSLKRKEKVTPIGIQNLLSFSKWHWNNDILPLVMRVLKCYPVFIKSPMLGVYDATLCWLHSIIQTLLLCCGITPHFWKLDNLDSRTWCPAQTVPTVLPWYHFKLHRVWGVLWTEVLDKHLGAVTSCIFH